MVGGQKEIIMEKSQKESEYLDDILQNVLSILEGEGSFEDKRAASIDYLRDNADNRMAQYMIDLAEQEKTGEKVNHAFWQQGKITASNLTLRPISESDREGYIRIQHDNPYSKSMIKEPVFASMLWKEHIHPKSLLASIDKDSVYVGYCGVKNVAADIWEVTIELLPEHRGQGIGKQALTLFFNAVKSRLNITSYVILVAPDNKASQALFESLGAVPKGLSKMPLPSETITLSEEDAREIAEHFMIPAKDLTDYALEYRLEWAYHCK